MTPSTPRGDRCDRSIAPVVGVLALVVLAVGLGAVVAVGVSSVDPGGEPSSVVLELSAESATNEVVLEHRYGETLDVTELEIVVAIGGDALETHPPVPFFQADGFRGGPTGPFNERADPSWQVGERASFEIAATNEPTIDPGDEVVVTILEDGERVSRAAVTAD